MLKALFALHPAGAGHSRDDTNAVPTTGAGRRGGRLPLFANAYRPSRFRFLPALSEWSRMNSWPCCLLPQNGGQLADRGWIIGLAVHTLLQVQFEPEVFLDGFVDFRIVARGISAYGNPVAVALVARKNLLEEVQPLELGFGHDGRHYPGNRCFDIYGGVMPRFGQAARQHQIGRAHV